MPSSNNKRGTAIEQVEWNNKFENLIPWKLILQITQIYGRQFNE